MTFAFQDIDALENATQEVKADDAARHHAAQMHVMIVAADMETARAIAAPMALEPTIRIECLEGGLSELVGQGSVNLASCDFVVFHTVPGDADDLAAVHCLHTLPHARVQCIAVIDGPVSDDIRAELALAGVQEVLSAPARPAARDVAPVAADEASGQTQLHTGRLHFSATACDVDQAGGEDGDLTADATRVQWSRTRCLTREPQDTADAGKVSAPALPDGPAIDLARSDASDETNTAPPLAATPLTSAPSQTPLTVPDSTCRITTVLRARGGSGASTMAVNLAVTLAQGGDAAPRVALVDLDIQNGSVSVLLDMADSTAFASLLRSGTLPDQDFVDAAMTRHASGVDVLAAPDIFAPMNALSPQIVAALLDHLATRYDHIIIDMPQAMMDWVEPVLDRASLALIVTDTSVPAIKRARRLIDVLIEEHMTLSVQVVVNREKKPLFRTAAQKEAGRILDRALDHWVPEDAAPARQALDAGVPLVTGARRSKATRAIRCLCTSLFPLAGVRATAQAGR